MLYKVLERLIDFGLIAWGAYLVGSVLGASVGWGLAMLALGTKARE